MNFYLGTHMAYWLSSADFPLFVSHSVLRRKCLPRSRVSWCLDSGAFSTLSEYGCFPDTAEEYAVSVRRYREEIGNLLWASPQDWMCEPFMLAKTGLTVADHQQKTVANYCRLKQIAPDLPFIPVLQGWTLDDYLRCIDAYEFEWVDLRKEPLVGLGSVCRRQNTKEAAAIILRLFSEGLTLHAFGFKLGGLKQVAHLLESADSMAWSYDARRSSPLPGHKHKSCANCYEYAALWRQKALSAIKYPKQWAMDFAEAQK